MLDSNHASLTLLIAEDHPDVQGLLRDFMDSWGYHADIVSNGLEAVQHARAGTYDLCLMDRRMPVMDGLTAAETTRRRTPYFPILMFSFDPPPPLAYLTKKGIDDWIEKDCDPSYLHERITEWGNTRTISIAKHGNQTTVKREMPMDVRHAKEIRELKSQNLVKVKFDDITGSEVIVHENVINKIVDDFNIKKQFVSTFLNRDPEKPTKCVLFGNNCRMPQIYLTDTDFSEELKNENEELDKYSTMRMKPEKDSPSDL
jgi:CheY-like chemotaxis protein